MGEKKYYAIIISFYVLVYVAFFGFTDFTSYFTFSSWMLVPTLVLIALSLMSLYFVDLALFEQQIGYTPLPTQQVLSFLFFAVVLISLPEEILFRTWIQNWLVSATNPALGIVLSAGIFGTAHIFNEGSLRKPNMKLIALTFVAGIFLGLAFFITQSLLVTTFMHVSFLVGAHIYMKAL